MRTSPAAAVLLLHIACACTTLAACATKDPGPAYPWPRDDARGLAPIVVRSAAVESTTRGEYSPGQQAATELGSGLGNAAVHLFFPIVGPVSLLYVPIAIAEARQAYTTDQYCPPRVRAAIGDVPKWVQSTFGAVSVVDVVEGARRRAGRTGPAVTYVADSPSSAARTDEISTIGTRLGADTLILADIHVEFGEMVDGCKVKLTAHADVRVQPVGQPEMTRPRYHVWVEQNDVPVEDWAAKPAHAQEQLRALLARLGAQLVESYRDRMGCSDRDCGW